MFNCFTSFIPNFRLTYSCENEFADGTRPVHGMSYKAGVCYRLIQIKKKKQRSYSILQQYLHQGSGYTEIYLLHEKVLDNPLYIMKDMIIKKLIKLKTDKFR